ISRKIYLTDTEKKEKIAKIPFKKLLVDEIEDEILGFVPEIDIKVYPITDKLKVELLVKNPHEIEFGKMDEVATLIPINLIPEKLFLDNVHKKRFRPVLFI